MAETTTLFFDVGGVVLTNGWDRDQRRAAAERFELDWEEFADRHDLVAAQWETGDLSLDAYLERTVFHRDRPFDRQDLTEFMYAQSAPLPGMFDLLGELAASGRYYLATLNNESLELNHYRVTTFGLRRFFQAFFSSGSLGVRKPDKAIYDIALSVTMRSATECLFIDDRELNLQCAALEGMGTVLHEDVDQLRRSLAELGIEL